VFPSDPEHWKAEVLLGLPDFSDSNSSCDTRFFMSALAAEESLGRPKQIAGVTAARPDRKALLEENRWNLDFILVSFLEYTWGPFYPTDP